MRTNHDRLHRVGEEISSVLTGKIIPFWLERGIDRESGGFLTSFDENGRFTGDAEKYIVTQTRQIWGFSRLQPFAAPKDRPAMQEAARQGYRFFLDHFRDRTHGGFIWKTSREGAQLDGGKLVYGESFAIYALSEYHRVSGDAEALARAEETFDLLQIYAADTARGGYYENLEPDWSVAAGGKYAGDRKSLDIHMHLMEAFTTLCAATGKEIHRRKLLEVVELLLTHMVNTELGYGYNQFDLNFRKLPAIDIYRTWNADRETGEEIDTPTDTTSYGHNVELSWLLDTAFSTLKLAGHPGSGVIRKLLDHSLRHGYDYEYGGVFRDGVADGEVLVTDKEWWQNFESLVGYLNGFVKFRDERYLEAFLQTWEFVRDNFIDMAAGESRQLLDRRGKPLVANLGNPWKGIYHTGRALAECLERINGEMQK